jgi:hypothetical protein
MVKCENEFCKTEASFNFKDMPRRFCSKHKFDNMINVKDFTCIYKDCIKPAYYNYKGNNEKKYCINHKLENMVNVKSKLCEFEGCEKQPLFNFKNNKNARFCNDHKEPLMIDVKHTICFQDNCINRARYNYFGNKVIYCFEHKLEDMIDIDAKKCKYKDCIKRPCFNYIDKEIGIYCQTHKLENMVDVVNCKCCFDDCNKKASFNYKGEKKLLYCFTHRLKDMVNITITKCKTHLCDTKANPNYENYCLRCFIHTYPDKKIKRNFKTKEQTVVNFVKKEFPNLTIINDRINLDGCSKKRPDIQIDLGYQIIIIEIDEKQHKQYENICENKRIMEISQDNNHRPIIFIKFNPDNYIKNGVKIQSCWKILESGILTVDKSKNKEWIERLNCLKFHIENWCNPNNILNKTVEVIKLYFDE